VSVLITKGSSIKALVCARSLGKQGIDVIVGDSGPNPSSVSKYVKGSLKYPSPLNEKAFIEYISHYCSIKGIKMILPVHSEDTYLIAKNRSLIEDRGTIVPLAHYKDIIKINDKSILPSIAENAGIPIPQTYVPKSIGDVEDIAIKCHYPVVLKLRNATSSTGIMYLNDRSSLISGFKKTVNRFGLKASEYPLIQEYVKGTGYGVSVLYNHGEIRALFTHKRIREFPISGGPSTARVSVHNKKLEEMAVRLMDSVYWHGLAMVEFKFDEKTGEAWLIEVNPRVWGSIYQAVAAGVDFPYLLYRMSIDGDIKPVKDYNTGVYTRYLLNDIRAFPKYQKAQGISFLKDFFSLKYLCDDFQCDDPLPFFSLGLYNMFKH